MRKVKTIATGYRACGFCRNSVREETITVVTLLTGRQKRCCPLCLARRKEARQEAATVEQEEPPPAPEPAPPRPDILGPYRVLARRPCVGTAGVAALVFG